MTTTLKGVVQKFIIDNIIRPTKKSDEDYVVLIVDDKTLHVISTSINMQEINKAGVGVVLNIKYARDTMNIPAIYFIEPTDENINILNQDFTKKNTVYKSAHLFFNGHLRDEQMENIKSNSVLVSKVETFKEMDLNFLAVEDNVFSLELDSLNNLYGNGETNKFLKSVGKRLASLCITLNEFPFIRFYRQGKANLSLAEMLEKELKKKIRILPDWKYNKNPGTILIVDRAFEAVVPLMHEYTFKAMVADLFKIRGDFIDYQIKGKEKTVFVMGDSIWNKFRDTHIATVIKEIPELSSQFIANNPVLKIKSKENIDAKDLMKALRDAPQYKKEASSFEKNINLAEACMDLFKKENLKLISEFEQDMATGLDDEGMKLKQTKIEKTLRAFFEDSEKCEISKEKKLRLLMVYCSTIKDINEGLISDLSKKAKFTHEMSVAIDNLTNFTNNRQRTEEELRRNKEYVDKHELSLMRYLPLMYDVMDKFCDDTLDENEFPYLKEPPEKENAKAKGRRRKNNETEKPTLIVFVLGGITHSEIRCLHAVSELHGRNIFIGSTKVINAKEYIEELSSYE